MISSPLPRHQLQPHHPQYSIRPAHLSHLSHISHPIGDYIEIFTMSSPKIIVFGATGTISPFAARTAYAADEQAAGFERVYADLTKPETLRAAVAQTGATRAFIYMTFGTADHQRSGFDALRAAGIDFVVYLSNFAISAAAQGPAARDIPASLPLAYAHARVEMALEDVFGPAGFVALRPTFFARNVLPWFKKTAATDAGGVHIYLPYPEAVWDFIAPEDIGRVGGIVLASGPAAYTGPSAVTLSGPQLLSQEDAALANLVAAGRPAFLAKAYVEMLSTLFNYSGREEAVANVEKYGGRAATTFEQWVGQHRDEFGL
ncbi:hypothetical protein B0T26DRAFT_872757 [Lasiosphaeria miniovina]|uniref:NmrA-like domain-containing protein n=1 Tax=Lasiosphaeria miniovina TaxID=1954250 RepID=A0AA40AMM9_9PEZI|nr:uncharacterized protein B0T26DRAFT_872757 [Lasiosphaeria miniovina]KAK0718614.1 hypothetical protein B0T26DRAFT_872757 [Lasiosphaeria miniovina]